jgi:hypothetical protein
VAESQLLIGGRAEATHSRDRVIAFGACSAQGSGEHGMSRSRRPSEQEPDS